MKREQVVQFCEKAGPFADDLLAQWPTFGITTPARQAAFLAQVAHESAGFTRLVENLNYSVEALRRVFGKYFPSAEEAARYARQPEKIANRVYADRLGNGDEASGDGWRYRGRGLIQITGRYNYRVCSVALFGDERLLAEPQLLERPAHAVGSACWYWNSRELNALADADAQLQITRRINGGEHGHADRLHWLARARTALTPPSHSNRPGVGTSGPGP